MSALGAIIPPVNVCGKNVELEINRVSGLQDPWISFYAFNFEAEMAHLTVHGQWSNVKQRREKTMRKKEVWAEKSFVKNSWIIAVQFCLPAI